MMRFLFIVLLTLLGEAMAGMRHGTAVALNGEPVAQLTRYEHEFFPLMSVVKLPLAVVVLHHVEQGKLRLVEHYQLAEADMAPNTWSPMQKRFPKGGSFSLESLLLASLCESDNNACNYLFRLVGGPQRVQQFFKTACAGGFAFLCVSAHTAPPADATHGTFVAGIHGADLNGAGPFESWASEQEAVIRPQDRLVRYCGREYAGS